MMTALVLAERGGESLALTLGALVAGVAEGVIGDAVVVTRRDDRSIPIIADATGAALVRLAPGGDPWIAGAAEARRDWFLLLQDGDCPGEGWIRALERFVLFAPPAEPPLGRLRGRVRWPHLLERVTGRSLPRAGDVAHRMSLGRPSRVTRLGVPLLRDGGPA